MKTVIAGSRDITDYSILVKAMAHFPHEITEVVSGKARGVDTLGEIWANQNNVPVKEMPANWNEYGKKAGAIRNAAMGKYADAALIVWDGESRGTRHMIEVMQRLGKFSHVYFIEIPHEQLRTIEDFLE